MQDEDQDLKNLRPEIVQKAIDAVKARDWDVNPFTVADELKVSRAAIYRQPEIMQLIIVARGGSFGMDVQTSLDLTWQLRQLEQQNIELKEKLGLNVPEHTQAKAGEEQDEAIYNLASNGHYTTDYLAQLNNLSWKDVETVYYFRVASLKEHAKKLFDADNKSNDPNGESSANISQSFEKGSISYGSLASMGGNKRQKQSSASPFASLKTGIPGNLDKEEISVNVLAEPLPEPVAEFTPEEESESNLLELASQIQMDLAAKIRASLTVEEAERSQPFADEMETWGSLKPYGADIASEKEVQTGDNLPLVEIEPYVNNDIKLIPLLKEKNEFEILPDKFSQEIEQSSEEEPNKEAISGDELRNLIQSHIKNAAEQMAEFSQGHSIGTGKEFEVWLNNPAKSKFVGSTKAQDPSIQEGEPIQSPVEKATFKPRVVPPEVRKACLILGVRPDNITFEVVQEAWKTAIAAPGVHPDLGGDTELAIYLNTAKDVLMRFLDAQAPKLGKKFGPFKKDKDKDAKPKTDKTDD